MQQIIFFFVRNKNLLLFLLLFSVSILLTINTHSYHQNKFATSANALSGGLYDIKSGITRYFDLDHQNELLQEENRKLRTLLALDRGDSILRDSLQTNGMFRFVRARVINNSVSKTKNYLTIDKGTAHQVKVDMGVVAPGGIIGIVHDTSRRYASVQSVLNTNSQISARLKKTGHFGTLIWEGEDPYHSTLIDISSQVPITMGDTVVTDGRSTIFPEGLLIGTVSDIRLENNQDYYRLEINLAADLTSVSHVYLIENLDREEIKELENRVEDAEQ